MSMPVDSYSRTKVVWFSNLTTTGSDNGLSPGRRQAIILTDARILVIGPLGTHFSETLIKILTFLFHLYSFIFGGGHFEKIQ